MESTDSVYINIYPIKGENKYNVNICIAVLLPTSMKELDMVNALIKNILILFLRVLFIYDTDLIDSAL